MEECLRFENAIFRSRNCNFSRFSAHNLSITNFNVMFKFSYSKYNPRWLILGGGGEGLILGRSFLFQKLVPKRPGDYTRWGLLSKFYGIFSGNTET